MYCNYVFSEQLDFDGKYDKVIILIHFLAFSFNKRQDGLRSQIIVISLVFEKWWLVH